MLTRLSLLVSQDIIDMKSSNYNDVIISAMVFRLFTQPFVRAQLNENIKAPRHWSLSGEFPTQRASATENVSI